MENYFLIYDWMPLIRPSDKKYPVYMGAVRASFPNTSFPNPIRDYILEEFDYMPVFAGPEPTYDVNTEYLQEEAPVLGEDGKWYKTWTVQTLNEEQLEENLRLAKDELLANGASVLGADISYGIPYTLDSVDYLVDVNPNSLSLLVSVKSLAKDAPDGTDFPYSFVGDIIVTLTKEQFLDMWQTVNTRLYAAYKAYWEFRMNVTAIPLIADLPELPLTFKD